MDPVKGIIDTVGTNLSTAGHVLGIQAEKYGSGLSQTVSTVGSVLSGQKSLLQANAELGRQFQKNSAYADGKIFAAHQANADELSRQADQGNMLSAAQVSIRGPFEAVAGLNNFKAQLSQTADAYDQGVQDQKATVTPAKPALGRL